MPIRESKARLWFNTKEEQDEFDDKMIAAIQYQSDDPDSDYYAPVFMRKKKEQFLDLTKEAQAALDKLQHPNIAEIADKYHTGKRDHTYYRNWTIHKFALGYLGSYLLLRELPIRNFYARGFIMLAFITKIGHTWGKVYAAPDDWTYKTIQNYGVFKTMTQATIPTLDGKLPQETLWKLNQPGYMTDNHLLLSNCFNSLFKPKRTQVEWDGTFNMPVNGLVHPKSLDSKGINFLFE